MKKIVVCCIALMASLMAFSNIYIPEPAKGEISELYLNEQGEWSLEISFYGGDPGFFLIDSIVIFTSKSRYKLNIELNNPMMIEYQVVHKSEIGDSLIINSEGDEIIVKTFWEINPEGDEHQLIFGNYANSQIEAPQQGLSICFYDEFESFFIVNPQPSLGEENIKGNAFAQLNGFIYHNNQKIISGKRFGINFKYYLRTDGFEAKIIPGSYTISEIAWLKSNDTYNWYEIEPIEINLTAGESKNQDIHITDLSFVGLNEKVKEAGVIIYPNPSTNTLNVEIKDELIFQKSIKVEIYNIESKKVLQQSFNPGSAIHVDVSAIPAGIYTLQIRQENELISSQKIIINSF